MPTQRLHAWLDVATPVPGPPGLPRVIQDEGTALPVRTVIDMRGAGVTATDDPIGDKTVITIPGGTADMVVSVFGRPGPVITAQAGDYTAAQVTNAVSTAGSYSDPAWITSIAWDKISGEPSSFPPSAHTHPWSEVTSKPVAFPPEAHQHPWGDITGTPSSFPPAAHVHAAADVTSGVFAAARLGSGTGSAGNYLRGDGAWTALTAAQVSGVVPNTTQVIAGTGLTGGGALSANVTLNANIAGIQTPWVSNIDGAGFKLTGASVIGVSAVNVAGADSISGLTLDRAYGEVGDSMDIVFGASGPNRAARVSCNITAGGEMALVCYAMTGGGDGYGNEVCRMNGFGRVDIRGKSNTDSLRIYNTGSTKYFGFQPESATDQGTFGYWNGAWKELRTFNLRVGAAGDGEGGEVRLEDVNGSVNWYMDIDSGNTWRFRRGAAVYFVLDPSSGGLSTTVPAAGSKILYRDASGFVKIAF